MALTNMALSSTLKPIQPASPSHAQAIAAAQARIDSALANGATGPKGFLQWVIAAWPAPIANKILAAAKAHMAASNAALASGPIGQMNAKAKAGMGSYDGPTTFGAIAPVPTRGSYPLSWAGRQRRGGMGRVGAYADPAALLSGLGQTSSGIGASTAFAPISIDTTGASTNPTVANASTSSASPSWLSSISTAISGAVQGYLGVQQAKDAQTLFDTNLQRAQQGLSPLNANPSAYGIVSPQLNVGLASGTQSLIMWGAIGAGVLGLGYLLVHATKK